jgi:hypothetical protein
VATNEQAPPAFLLQPPYAAAWAAWRRAQASGRPNYREDGEGWRIRVIPRAGGDVSIRLEVDFHTVPQDAGADAG